MRKPPLRKSSEQCKDDVYKRYLLLTSILKKETVCTEQVYLSCGSMVAFAKLSYKDDKIEFSSIGSRNTLFKYADIVFDKTLDQTMQDQEGNSGKEYLDWLRKRVREQFEKAAGYRSEGKKKEREQAEIEILKNSINMLQHGLTQQTNAFVKLWIEIRSFSRGLPDQVYKKRLESILEQNQKLFADVFSFDALRQGETDNVHKIWPL